MTARIRWLAIPTGQRPVELRRAIVSFSQHIAAHGWDVPIAIFHSPRTALAQAEVEAAIAGAVVDGARVPLYIGVEAKIGRAKLLRRKTKAPPALLEFALFNPLGLPPGPGGNRNAILLWGAGHRLLSTDDDTLAKFALHPEADAGSRLNLTVVAGDPADYFVPPEGDLSPWHVADGDPRFPFGGLVGAFEAVFAAGAAAGISPRLVFAGLSGDCGWAAPFGFFGLPIGYLMLPTEALQRLTATEQGWRAALERRELMRVVSRPKLSRGGPGMTTTFGIDAAGALPPFLPVARGQDLFFSALVERLTGVPSAHVPLAVAHVPAPGRSFHRGELWRAAQSLDLCRVLFAFLETLPAGADLAGFGRHLRAQTAGGDLAFAMALREARQVMGERLVAEARARAAGLPALPPFWHNDLDRFCALAEESVREPGIPWVLDTGATDAAEALSRARVVVDRYGALCEVWPELWDAARALASEDSAMERAPARVQPPPSAHAVLSEVTEPSPCSPWQTGFLQLHTFDPDDASYVIFRALRGDGPVDEDRLEAALRAVAERQEALRCRLAAGAWAEPRLELRPAVEMTIERIGPISGRDLEQARAQARMRPFDLRRALPLRLTLVRTSDPMHWELWLGVHHAFFDGASVDLLWRELSAAYASLSMGAAATANLKPLQCGFRAHAWKLRGALGQEVIAARQRYWSERMAGAPVGAQVSWRLPSPNRGNECHCLRHALPVEFAERLVRVARQQRASVAALCLAAWQTVIYRWSGQADVVIGVDFENRWTEADEEQIGLFASALPIRTNLGDDPTLSALIKTARIGLSDALAQGCLPADALAQLLSKGRQRFAFFPNMYTYRIDTVRPELAGVHLDQLHLDVTQAWYDLGLTVEESGSTLSLALVGNQSLFDRGDLRRLGIALEMVLEQIALDPATRLTRLTWMSAADQALIDRWNATSTDYPRNRPLTELLRKQADLAPNKVVLETPDVRVTYRDLWRRAEALAARLRGRGVMRDVRVGLFLDRHPSTLEAMLGILLAGGGYLPLDPSFPRDRLRFMLDDAGVRVLVTRRALVRDLPSRAGDVVCLDEDEAPAATPPNWQGPTGESLAYVLYTSGSTGRPKGVEIPHRALVNFLCSMARVPGLAPNDIVLALTTISFDIAGLELWLPQLVGASLWMAGREEAADAQLLASALVRSRATVLQATPSTWRLLLNGGCWSGDPRLKALVGGEALPPDLAWRLAAACGEAWNLYGPTETTIWSTVWRIPRTATPPPVRIGRPIANTELHVLDDGMRPLPVGVVGELYIGGDGVARGYLGRTELNRERFVADPASGGGARMYRTGDLVRWMPDGELAFVGRNDAQLKVHGYRIEPGEVEVAILQLPEITQAAVGLHAADGGEPRLVAFIVLRSDSVMPGSAALRARLRRFLVDHMLPLQFIAVDSLPMTPNGKVDRNQLTALHRSFVEVEPQPCREPLEERLNSVEMAVAAEFEALLGHHYAADTDFFDSGGDSISGLRLISRVAHLFGVPLSGGDLFLHSTARQLASRVLALDKSASARLSLHLVTLRAGGDLPPVIFVHPRGGQLLAYARLAQHIDLRIPLHGLEGRFERAYDSWEQRATAYVNEVIRAWPGGGIAFCGYSLGGPLALEMAAQLQRRGLAVGPVFLLDSWVPRPPRDWPERFVFHLGELRRFTWAERRLWFHARLRSRLQWLTGSQEPVPIYDEEDDITCMEQMRRIVVQGESWRPPHYDGGVVLFRAAFECGGFPAPKGALGWDVHYPRIQVHECHCDHLLMVHKPFVAEIGGVISRCLQVCTA